MISLEKLKEYREHILDLAIRGKLVEQRPEEGTAEDLYQQIQEEKAKLIKEGKLKKEKPLASIEDDEIPFDIPESWKWVRISDCVQVNPSVKFNDESEVSFVPMTNIEAGYRSAINLTEVKLWKDVKKNFSRFQNEDVIVAKITPCFQNRKSAIAKNLVNGYGAGTTELNILRTAQFIDNLFLLYFVKSPYFIRYGIDNFSGTVGQQRFGGDSLKQTFFPLPPLAEQKRIASKVESYLSVINKAEELLNRKVDLDGQIKEKILQMAIQGKLVEQRPEEGTAEDLYQQIQEEKAKLIKEGKLKKEKPLVSIEDDEIPFDIPESWKWVRISDCVQVNPSVKFNDEAEVSFIPMTNIEAGYRSAINLTEVKLWKAVKKNFSKFQNEDVIVAKITPCFQNRKSAIAKNLVNGYGAGTTELNILRTAQFIDNLFLLYFVKSPYFIRYGVDNFSGTVGQQRFGGDSLKQTLFPLPPLAEQKRIVAKVEELLALCDKLKLE